MKHFLSTLAVCSLLLTASPAAAQSALNDPLVVADTTAERIVRSVLSDDSQAEIEVVGKRLITDDITATTYTQLKLRVDGADRIFTAKNGGGAVSEGVGLPGEDAAALLASVRPGFSKISADLVRVARESLGPVLDTNQPTTALIDVDIYSANSADLAAVRTAVIGSVSGSFDSQAVFSANPPVLRNSGDGSATLPVAAPTVFAVTARLTINDILRVADLPSVTYIEETKITAPNLAESVPHIGGDLNRDAGNDAFGLAVSVLDTGIDETHPDLPKVIAEMDFIEDVPRCDHGDRAGLPCACPGGTCVAEPDSEFAFCDGGDRDERACGCPEATCEDELGDSSGHGTHVAGIISNVSDSNTGMTTAADLINAKVVPGNAARAAAATIFSRDIGASVINASFGVARLCVRPTPVPGALEDCCLVDSDCDSFPGAEDGECAAGPDLRSDGASVFSRALDFETFANNIPTVVSAGNCGPSRYSGSYPVTPADAYNSITVGASELRVPGASGVADFSNVGPTTNGRSKPDVLAPGAATGVDPDGIDSTAQNWEIVADFREVSGTSQAAAHVSGLIAQLIDFGDANGILTDTPYLKAAVINNARRLSDGAGWNSPSEFAPLDPVQGAGEVDAAATLAAYSDFRRVWQQAVTGTGPEDSHWYLVEVEGASEEAPVEIVGTLVWERQVEQTDGATPPSAREPNDLDLNLYNFRDELVARSASPVDNVEHLVHGVTKDGTYCLEVDAFDLSRTEPAGIELYAIAANLQMRFFGDENPCATDFGDAPDPTYPTELASDGARHITWIKEWLGNQRPRIDGDLEKATLEPVTFENPLPTRLDDGVVLPEVFRPLLPNPIEVSVRSTVGSGGTGANGRYQASDPRKRLYVNAWADWNGDGDWDDADEKVIGTGSPLGTAAFNPETFVGNESTRIFQVVPPAHVTDRFFVRVRLDYGEDAGNVANLSGNLNGVRGEARFGEVEDHLYNPSGNDLGLLTTLSSSARVATARKKFVYRVTAKTVDTLDKTIGAQLALDLDPSLTVIEVRSNYPSRRERDRLFFDIGTLTNDDEFKARIKVRASPFLEGGEVLVGTSTFVDGLGRKSVAEDILSVRAAPGGGGGGTPSAGGVSLKLKGPKTTRDGRKVRYTARYRALSADNSLTVSIPETISITGILPPPTSVDGNTRTFTNLAGPNGQVVITGIVGLPADGQDAFVPVEAVLTNDANVQVQQRIDTLVRRDDGGAGGGTGGLGITLDGPRLVRSGDQVRLILRYQDLEGVGTMRMTLPAGMTLASVDPANTGVEPDGTLRWDDLTRRFGTFDVRATVDSSAASGTILSSFGSITATSSVATASLEQTVR